MSHEDDTSGKRSFCNRDLFTKIVFHLLLLSLLILITIISWHCGVLALIMCILSAIYTRFMKSDEPESPKSHTGTITSFSKALNFVQKTDELRNYRPQILVLTGNPAARPALVDFVHNITKDKSLMMCGYIMQEHFSERAFSKQEKIQRHMKDWTRQRGIQADVVTVASPSIKEGTAILLQTVGVGILRPNILMMGFKTNWIELAKKDMSVVNEFYGTVELGLAKNLSLVIFRNSDAGLDMSEEMRKYKLNEEDLDIENSETVPKMVSFQRSSIETEDTRSYRSNKGENNVPRKIMNLMNKRRVADIEAQQNEQEKKENGKRFKFSVQPDPDQHKLMLSMSKFHTPIKDGVIDVWWLQDNGGLALLLPHLLTLPKSYLENATIRVFTASGENKKKISTAQQAMTAKLRLFGIDHDELTIIDSLEQSPNRETEHEFHEIVKPFIAQNGNRPIGYTTTDELRNVFDKTKRNLRLAELIREHSREADLVVCSLPVTRHEEVSSSVYLSWLEMITRGLPPFLLVKGNQTPVHTYFK